MRLKNSKNVLSLGLVTVLAFSFLSVPASAASYILGWDLVDSGKHLDYDGNSKYMSYVSTGASIWNSYKSGVIRKDSLTVIQDVYISDISSVNGATGTTSANGKIQLNAYYLDKCTYSQIVNTVTHELGHALGLDHGPSSTDIMYTSQTSVNSLSKNDKDSYDAAYNLY